MRESDRQSLTESIESLIVIELKKAMEAGKHDAADALAQRVLNHSHDDILDESDKAVIQNVFQNLIDEEKVLRYMNPKSARKRSVRGYIQAKRAYFVVKKYHEEGEPLADDGAFQSAAEQIYSSVASVKRGYYEYKKTRNEWIVPIIKKMFERLNEGLNETPQNGASILFYLDCLVETTSFFGISKKDIVDYLEEWTNSKSA